jgi:deoxycytidine triphosphate deaminase
MILDPVSIANDQIIDSGKVAQNGIDCHLFRMVEVIDGGIITNGKNGAVPPSTVAMEPIDGFYNLEAGRCYSFECKEVVNIPVGMCAMLVGRSSLNRRGCNVFSGLYDSGYHGRVGGTLRSLVPLKLAEDFAILQIVFMQSEGTRMYKGQYQHSGLREEAPKAKEDIAVENAIATKSQMMAAPIEGRKFDEGKPRFDLIDPLIMQDFARALTYGAKLHGDDNWRKGLGIKRCYAALQRHLTAYMMGERDSQDAKIHHLGHAMANIMFMRWMEDNQPAFDDRQVFKTDSRIGEPL